MNNFNRLKGVELFKNEMKVYNFIQTTGRNSKKNLFEVKTSRIIIYILMYNNI